MIQITATTPASVGVNQPVRMPPSRDDRNHAIFLAACARLPSQNGREKIGFVSQKSYPGSHRFCFGKLPKAYSSLFSSVNSNLRSIDRWSASLGILSPDLQGDLERLQG
jgi:hypothetical protein